MNKEQFVGTWKLVSSEFKLSNGQVAYPYGTEAIGMLMYSAGGHMAVQIMRPGRLTFLLDDRLGGNTEEIKSAFEGYAAYYGTYEVDQEAGTVMHHVEGSLFPNSLGIRQKRYYEFSGDRLTLCTPEMLLGGQRMTGLLHWRRVE